MANERLHYEHAAPAMARSEPQAVGLPGRELGPHSAGNGGAHLAAARRTILAATTAMSVETSSGHDRRPDCLFVPAKENHDPWPVSVANPGTRCSMHTLVAMPFLLLCLAARAQKPQEEPKTSRTPTPTQIAERLEQVKRDLLPKCWAPKIGENQLEQKKYLAKWQVITSPHYILFTNGPTATCKKYSTTLEELYSYVQKELPFADIDHLLTCYIFDSREEYYRFCGAVAGWSEAQARGTAGHATSVYYACYYESPRAAVVFHEATHQIVGACLKVTGVGSWFQEGLAVYFEKKIAGENPAATIKGEIKRGDYYPLAEFFAIESLLSDPKGHGHRNYEQAGALLDFMINTKLPPVAGKFTDFLSAARKGRGFGRGAEISAKLVKDVYGLSVEQFEALWKQHVGVK